MTLRQDQQQPLTRRQLREMERAASEAPVVEEPRVPAVELPFAAEPVPAPAAEAAPANPPPSDAVISAQSDGEVRADQLIGMTVYNAAGEKVGSVHDILLDKEGKATGVVLSVGGVLGVGAKSVGLTWKEIDVKPEQQQVQISYTKDQLEAAPDFKTTEQINSEMNVQQQAVPPAGTTGTGGTTTQP